MNKEELIEVLRQFDEKRVEELPEKTRNIFYAIMKIADERDELKNIINEAKEECKSVIGNPEHTIVSKNELMKLMLNILNKGDNNE
ncbi:MAG: hypothetical protein IIV48_03225 [Clostridium sp.]|nr:hypothetical protein [Clostridium sp.]